MITANTMYVNHNAHETLPQEHIDLVKRIAYRLVAGLPESVQVEDLIQAGMLGLLEAQQRYSADEGASFETFAGIRIRGAMLDEIRSGDWTPRSVHRAARASAEARTRVEHRWNRPANDNEIATELGVSLADYHKNQADAASAQLGSLDELSADGANPQVRSSDCNGQPPAAVERQSLYDAVLAASEHLPAREQLLMDLYYEQDLNLREIAQRLGVSESRVCQLHGRAIAQVRTELQEWAA